MMFKNKNKPDKDLEASKRNFSRQFGNDITSKVLNQSGVMGLSNQDEKNRMSANSQNSKNRKPSPSIHSNYQNPTKERNIPAQVSTF